MIKLLERRTAALTGNAKKWEELRRELCAVREQLECVDSCFDMAVDDALVEQLIYKRGELMAHYGKLLRRAKALEAETAGKNSTTPYQGRIAAE